MFSGLAHRQLRAALMLFLALLLAGRAALAHDDEFDAGWTDAERRAGHEQTLTMARIRQLVAINRALTQLAAGQPQTCNWMNQITGPEPLVRQIRAFTAYAPVRQVIEGASMSVQDYLLTLYAVSQTATVVHATTHSIHSEATASANNIRLYRSNQSQIETLLDEPDPC